jgi:hypothetical protein
MKDSSIAVLLSIALLAHLLIGFAVGKKIYPLTPLVLINLSIALAVLGYWAGKWYSYIFDGIQWYIADQWLPLYAALICCAAIGYFAGKIIYPVLHWGIFVIDLAVIVAALLFFLLFKINKLF